MLNPFKKCQICLNNFPAYGLSCYGCRSAVMNKLWDGCALCGVGHCAGWCHKMPQFENVKCVFAYDSFFSSLLVKAKDSQCVVSEALFKDLFFLVCVSKIVGLIEKYEIDTVILPPLSAKRVSTGAWHSSLMFEEVLKSIQKLNLASPISSFSVFFPNVKRQAYISAKNRIIEAEMLNYSANNLADKCFVVPVIEEDFKKKSTLSESCLVQSESKHVLLLDDVLTSGGTAIKTQRSAQKIFPNASWSYFSLFRSPQLEMVAG